MLAIFRRLSMVPGIEQKLAEYDLFIDRHRILVLNYKIWPLCILAAATIHLYRLSGQRIINDQVDHAAHDLQAMPGIASHGPITTG